MKYMVVIGALLLAGCLGPATERLEGIGVQKAQLYDQLVKATDAGVRAILTQQIEGLSKTEEDVIKEAAAERVAAREKRSNLFGVGMTVLNTVIGVGLAAGKKMLTGGIA
jgi:hypothetical protein